MKSFEQRVVEVSVQRIDGTASSCGRDVLAVEEPLEIRLDYGAGAGRTRWSITVTMRTPGCDVELAVGFLFAEGLVRRREDIERAESCGPPAGSLGIRNLVRVDLSPDVTVDEKRLARNFLTTSSCGLCGKASLDALPAASRTRLPDGFEVPASSIHDLPARLRSAQTVFDRTGGLHAAAIVARVPPGDLATNSTAIRLRISCHRDAESRCCARALFAAAAVGSQHDANGDRPARSGGRARRLAGGRPAGGEARGRPAPGVGLRDESRGHARAHQAPRIPAAAPDGAARGGRAGRLRNGRPLQLQVHLRRRPRGVCDVPP